MRLSRQQVFVVALLFVTALLNYVDRQVLSVLALVLREQIGLTQIGYAWAINAFLLSYALMYTGSGIVLDRLGSRKGLAFFVVAWSIASGLHAAASGFAALAALRFLLGVFEPGGWTGAVKTISERFTPVQRGLAAGIFASGSSVAMAITPPLVVFLTTHYGWRIAFLVPSVAGLLWLPFWLAATRGSAEVKSVERTPLAETLPMLLDKRVGAYFLARFFGDSSGYFLLFWIPDYLTSLKHFSFEMLGTRAWIPYVANDAGPILGGLVASRLIARGWKPLRARKTLMTVAAVVVSAGALSQATNDVWKVLLTLSVAAFGVGLWAGNLHALPADAFPPRIVATAYGLAGSAGAAGGILFNSLAGYFSARSDYSVVFAVLLMLQPLGVTALWLWMKDQKQLALPN